MADHERTIHLVPVAGAFIPGVPAIEQDVSPERAAELLAWRPPAFAIVRPPEASPATPQNHRARGKE